MDQLQSELLLSIFKQLDSKEMVKATRVCKTWFNVINQNQSPWRSLVLPNRREGWDASIIELFDRKSQSTLQRVSIELCDLYDPHNRHWDNSMRNQRNQRNQSVKATLERSKHTLQYLHLSVNSGHECLFDEKAALEDLSWKLPNLVHCAIGRDRDRFPTRIVQNPQSREPPSSLRALWVPSVTSVFRLHSHIMDQVVSLHVYYPLSSSEWRTILEKPAQKLKDLQIGLYGDDPTPQSSFDFPNLKVLQLDLLDALDRRFPSWLKIPSSSTFIDHTYDFLPTDLPSVSTVWVKHLNNIRTLEERCPVLAELRIDSGYDQIVPRSKSNHKSKLLSMLRTRKKRVRNGAEVDGVKMIPLKTLIVNFLEFFQRQISELRGTVKEVIDLNSVDKIIEVEC